MKSLLSRILIAFSLIFTTPVFAENAEVIQKARDLFVTTDDTKVDAAIQYFKERTNTDSVGVL